MKLFSTAKLFNKIFYISGKVGNWKSIKYFTTHSMIAKNINLSTRIITNFMMFSWVRCELFYDWHFLKLIIKFHDPFVFCDTWYDFGFLSNSLMRCECIYYYRTVNGCVFVQRGEITQKLKCKYLEKNNQCKSCKLLWVF